jgi:site-specific DNA-methyltransferase (adenine-specific)
MMIEDKMTIADSSARHSSKPPVASSTVLLGDNVELMKGYCDGYFDLAIVDPPYGIGEDGGEKNRFRKKDKNRRLVVHEKKEWDKQKPSAEYWKELFRVSKNQMVWGGNYFTDFLPPRMGWIFWDKLIGGDFSDGEFVWTSFNKAVRKYVYSYHGDTKGGWTRIHPTQKPISVYEFCLQYAKAQPNWKILDTHLGSGSSRIAADKAGLDFTGFEIDKQYFDAQEKRFKQYKSQLRIEGW